ncbi:MAG: acyltransferase [Legionella sp.]|nr:acyltransferase [Legionella sp.]
MSQKKLTEKIESLTSIRFFFAFIVVLVHINLIFPQYKFLPSALAQYGVTGFFMLSGMILTHVYKNENFLLKESKYNFYIKRITRIYPLYILPLFILLPIKMVEMIKPEYIPIKSLTGFQLVYLKNCTWANFGLQFLGLQSMTAGFNQAQYGWNGPGWSISTELCFYLFFPFIIPLVNELKNIYLKTLFIFLIIISMSLGYLISTYEHLYDHPVMSFIYMNPLIRLVEFILGIISYELCRYITNLKIFFYLLLIGVSIELLIFILIPQYLFFAVPLYLQLLLMYLLLENPVWMRSKLLVLLGNSSYSLYLLHFPILLYIALLVRMKLISITLIKVMIICISLIIISIITYKFYEKPLTVYLRKKKNSLSSGK